MPIKAPSRKCYSDPPVDCSAAATKLFVSNEAKVFVVNKCEGVKVCRMRFALRHITNVSTLDIFYIQR